MIRWRALRLMVLAAAAPWLVGAAVHVVLTILLAPVEKGSVAAAMRDGMDRYMSNVAFRIALWVFAFGLALSLIVAGPPDRDSAHDDGE